MTLMEDAVTERIILPNPPSGQLFEIKECLNGAISRFSLERWLVTESLAIGRWFACDDHYMPVGVSSWGCWWRGRSYGAYRIHSPDGSLFGYRLDVVENVRIASYSVQYRDLLLDAWIFPSGEVQIEDEDEVEAAVGSGLLTTDQYRRVKWTRELFRRKPKYITDRVDLAIHEATEFVRDLEGK